MTATLDPGRRRRLSFAAPHVEQPARTTPRFAVVAAYFVPVVAAISATFSWVQPGRFIAAGDVIPFVREGLAAELGHGWDHQLTGAGSVSYDVARLADVVVIRFARLFGGSDLAAQHLFYAILAALAAFGGAFLARSLVRNPAAVATGGLLAAFSPLYLISLPNPLPLLTVGMMGVLGGLLLRHAAGRRIRAGTLALASLPASYLAVNPPTMVVLAAWVVAVAAVGSLAAGAGGTRRALGLLARTVPLAVALHLWWIVPFLQVTVGGGAGTDFAAQTDVSVWSWSHAGNSLANVATLVAHWGWREPGYFPYSAAMDAGVWPVLRWLAPLATLGAVAVGHRGSRRIAVVLLGVAAVLVFVGKGLHAPFGGINAWLYAHLPGFWLLREPVTKVGPALALVYAASAALLVDGVLRRSADWQGWPRRGIRAGVAALAVATVAAPWPLWTGDVIPDDRGDLPPAHVTLPDGWRAVADAVNGSTLRGKVLQLPLAPFYQVTTSWGYHGADLVAQQLLRRPVLQRLPGGYFGNTAGVESLLRSAEEAVASGDSDATSRILRALGVSHVVVRHDLVPGPAGRALTDSRAISRGASGIPTLVPSGRFGVADLWELDATSVEVGPVQVHPRLVRARGMTVADVGEVVADLPADTVLTTDDTATADAVSWHTITRPSTTFTVDRPGSHVVTIGNVSPGRYRTGVRHGTTGSELHLYDLTRVFLDGEALDVPARWRIPLSDPGVVAISSDRSILPLPEGGGTTIAVGVGSTVVAHAAAPGAGLGPWSELEDCGAIDERSHEEAGLAVGVDGTGVRLEARAHSACVWAAVNNGNPEAIHQLELSYRAIEGEHPRVCVWQDGPDRCADLPPLAPAEGWATLRTFIRPDPGTTGLRLFLYADGADRVGERTVNEYRRAVLRPLVTAGSQRLERSSLEVVTQVTAGEHQLRLSQPHVGSILGPISNLEDCHAYDDRTPDEAGLHLSRPDHRTLRLAARSHTACVSAPLEGADAQGQYQLSLQHRTIRGRPARLCIWQEGPNSCADIPPLGGERTMQRYQAVFQPAPGTTALRLYLYADGPDGDAPPTTVEYRDIGVEPFASTPLSVRAAFEGTSTAPVLRWEQDGPAAYRVALHRVEEPFVLTLAESAAPGWELEGLPEGWRAEHVNVDGYANGWRISGRGDAELVMTYGPARTVRYATLLSAVVFLLLASTALHRRLPARIQRRDRKTSTSTGW